MQNLVSSIIGCLPTLLDVFVLFTFYYVIAGIMMVQLFGGTLNKRCAAPVFANATTDATTGLVQVRAPACGQTIAQNCVHVLQGRQGVQASVLGALGCRVAAAATAACRTPTPKPAHAHAHAPSRTRMRARAQGVTYVVDGEHEEVTCKHPRVADVVWRNASVPGGTWRVSATGLTASEWAFNCEVRLRGSAC